MNILITKYLLLPLVFYKMIFCCRGSSVTGTAVAYKSNERKKLEQSGYRIVGNIGDQWSDILGTNVGNRTFKLPDPMYYISWWNFELEFPIEINQMLLKGTRFIQHYIMEWLLMIYTILFYYATFLILLK